MRAIAVVRKIDIQLRGNLWQRELRFRRAHDHQNCRSHEAQERDEGGNSVARQTEHSAIADTPEEKRFARFDHHPPDIDSGAEIAQRGLNKIVFTNGYTARDDEHVAFACRLNRFCQSLTIISTMSN